MFTIVRQNWKYHIMVTLKEKILNVMLKKLVHIDEISHQSI